MAIEGFIGRPGAGKTYSMTALAVKEIAKGRDVYANYHLKGATLFGPDDLIHLPPGLVLIDEAHLWFPARGAMRLPPSWLAQMSQTRKNGWDIWWSAQHERRVDSVLKDVTNWLWLSTAWFSSGDGAPLYFRARSWEPEFFRKPKAHMTTRWLRFKKSIAENYDTYERIQVAAHAQAKNDRYATVDSEFAS